MRALLIVLNLALLVAILCVWFFWHPQPEERPLPGTYAEKLGRDIPVEPAAPVAGPSATGIAAREAYIPALPPGVRTGAAYLRIRNGGTRDTALVAAASSAAAAVELHTHVNDGGVMRMRQVKEIVVPAGKEVALQPGGDHVMLIDLKVPLVAGETLALTLSFANGDSLTVDAVVR
jgi:copper(I)-binding protein